MSVKTNFAFTAAADEIRETFRIPNSDTRNKTWVSSCMVSLMVRLTHNSIKFSFHFSIVLSIIHFSMTRFIHDSVAKTRDSLEIPIPKALKMNYHDSS